MVCRDWRAAFRRYPKADIRRAFELMDRVSIAHYANKRADELSGGERQRVGVVRALMQEPQILLPDERTASLDPKTSEQIVEFLRSLSNELSLPVLVNIHNVAEAMAYTGVVGMRYGRIIFDGLPGRLDDTAMNEIYAGIPAEERGLVPPDFSNIDSILRVLVETVNIATIATGIGVVASPPIAYIAAQSTAPNRATLWLGRFILVANRSVNTIIWALLFVAIFGPGALAGILAIAFRSLGFLGKLLGEAIEEIDRRPVETLEATDASRFKIILYAIVPQVVPLFWAVGILR